MKPRTREWISKAEGDWRMAQREMGAPDPVWDGICSLAHQCAEKYAKAYLEEQGIVFPKTHDLVHLIGLSGELLSELQPLREALAHLSAFGLAARYPGVEADRQAAEEALTIVEEVRAMVRRKLGFP